MNALIVMTALMGQCEGGQCDVPTFTAGMSVDVQIEAEHAKARRTPVRKAVRFVQVRQPVRTRLARLRENKPVRRVLGRVVRRLRR